jgi:hypothetical protein
MILTGESKTRALAILAMTLESRTMVEAAGKYTISPERCGQICKQIAWQMVTHARDMGAKVPPHDPFSHADRLIYRDFWREMIEREREYTPPPTTGG